MAFICNEVESRGMQTNNGDEGNKLLVGEKVEVLRFVEESHVCWYTGVITDCQSCYRIVKLDHMMDNGASSRIIQPISGSEAVPENCIVVEESYNKMIRPLPPIHDIEKSEIIFGQCVDVSIKDSWREGVLIGRTADYSKLLVFFPDMSVQSFVLASGIRLTQEWNDVSGQWRHRGMWLFLQIMKKIRQKNTVLSEMKEIWLRLKATDTFREKIKIWYSGSKLIWKELVLNVIRGTKSIVSSSLPATRCSSSVQKRSECLAHERVGRSSNVGNFSMASTSHAGKCCITTSNQIQDIQKQKHLEPHILDSGQKFISGVEIKEVDEHREDEKFMNNERDSKIVSSGVRGIKFTRETHDEKKSLASRAWKAVKLEGEFCHDLLQLSFSSHTEFRKHSMKKVKQGNPRIQMVKLRKHLVSIGWRIESKRDTILRFRYISPEQNIYYSLIKVLQNLLKENKKMNGQARDKGNSKDIDSGNHLLDTSPTKADFISQKQDQIMHPIDARLSENQQTAEVLCGESDSSGLTNCKVMQSNSPEFIGEKAQASGNCLGMITETLDSKENDIYENANTLHLSGVIKAYIDNIKILKEKPKLSSADVKELRSKAKDYLLKMGWKFWLINKKVRQELRYTSPNGKTYISLYSACKGYLEEVHCENTQKMSFECINDEKSFIGASNNMTSITPNKEEAHELPCDSGLIIPNNKKSLVMQKERFEQVKKRKIECQKSHVMQKEILEKKLFSSSNLSDSSEFNSMEHLDKKRELKKRQIERHKPLVMQKEGLEDLGRKRQLKRGKIEYQKSLVMQKENFEQGDFSSPSFFDSSEFYSNEHLGRKKLKRKKIDYPNAYVALSKQQQNHLNANSCNKKQAVKMEQGPFSSSKFCDFYEYDSKEHLSTKRELKRRNIKRPNTHAVLDKRLQNNYCYQKHAVKMDAFGASSSQKPYSRSFTSPVLRSGKRSRLAMFLSSKDQVAKTVLSWLIDKDVVLPRQKVAFVRKTDGQIMKEGWITHDGIKCRCCLNVFPLSKFGAHAGSRTSRPSTSIILQDGRSLLDCQKQILSALKSNKFQHSRLRRDFSNHEADDICTVCRDGGLIMLCDLCPSAFHPTCIGLEDVPEGKWFCPSCRCGICGLSEFNCDEENFNHNSGIYCDQCERQYHVGCLQKQGLQLTECPTGTWTCSKACSKIISHLRSLLGNPNPTHVKGLYWTILRSNIEDFGNLDDESVVESSGMLHIALDVMHECFESLFEARTQSDLATDIIFNRTSELNRLNFWGFYTMLLMGGDELIGVATFRIHGERLAEMPFIGTRVKFRRQGMCRILMNELQKLLCSLGVERLMLPAIPELLNIWTSTFGFKEMTSSDRLEFLEHPLLTFHGTTMCQKFLKKPSVSAN
ncbi:hypothetical protein IEQ34_002559 [Dendrobium chrysotoxum]|uniref:Uncharacterized protein n=1 Tax=Dendrobium chrysotoxum TaxID=161865 RepID=A0AAV7HLR1_DENCH|nr:hypothetical protein IEQ34_002559 [Dendrobium chrysotoxum]